MTNIDESRLFKVLQNKKLYFGVEKSFTKNYVYVLDDFYNLLKNKHIEINKGDLLLERELRTFSRESLLKIPGTMNRKHIINVISHD